MKSKLAPLIIIGMIAFHMQSQAQRANVWLTYNQSKFIYSPGIEVNFLIRNYLGIQIGANTYFNKPDKNKVVNISEKCEFNFYNTNIGACGNIIHNTIHQLGGTLGIKLYYGADYKYLTHFTDGGYDIYYDASEYLIDLGLDIGLYYSYKRINTILKFDTARYKWRFGIGYRLGKKSF